MSVDYFLASLSRSFTWEFREYKLGSTHLQLCKSHKYSHSFLVKALIAYENCTPLPQCYNVRSWSALWFLPTVLSSTSSFQYWHASVPWKSSSMNARRRKWARNSRESSVYCFGVHSLNFGPFVWNSLPLYIKHATAIDILRSTLKTCRFNRQQSDLPLPVCAVSVCM